MIEINMASDVQDGKQPRSQEEEKDEDEDGHGKHINRIIYRLLGLCAAVIAGALLIRALKGDFTSINKRGYILRTWTAENEIAHTQAVPIGEMFSYMPTNWFTIQPGVKEPIIFRIPGSGWELEPNGDEEWDYLMGDSQLRVDELNYDAEHGQMVFRTTATIDYYQPPVPLERLHFRSGPRRTSVQFIVDLGLAFVPEVLIVARTSVPSTGGTTRITVPFTRNLVGSDVYKWRIFPNQELPFQAKVKFEAASPDAYIMDVFEGVGATDPLDDWVIETARIPVGVSFQVLFTHKSTVLVLVIESVSVDEKKI